MVINCIIIDDEPLARKGLGEYISDIEFLNLVGAFENPLLAINLLTQSQVHLMFLDIQMPKITGLDFLKSMQHHPPVIFTTAYPQFALDGFDLNALDYLVKPISFKRFLKAASKAKEYYEVRLKNSHVENTNQLSDHFFIKADNKLIKILFNDVMYIEALQNYVNIYTTDGKYISYLTFKSVEEYLPADQFIKVHKSYIIALSKVNSIEANEIQVGKYKIPISRNLKDEVMQKLLGNRFLKR